MRRRAGSGRHRTVLLSSALLLAALLVPLGAAAANHISAHRGPSHSARAMAGASGRFTVDSRLILTPSQWKADQQGPTMDEMMPPDGLAMQVPILVWWLALELLGLLAFPFAFAVFAGLADRGWIAGKTLGVIVLGYLAWIGAATGVTTYDRGEILAALALFAVAAVVAAIPQRRAIGCFLRDHWRNLAAAEVVFLAGFILFLWLRAWYPDLGHQFSPVSPTNPGDGRMGEKQMELAFLNAIVRSRVFPPLDPFFAHGYINYYYFGFVLVATLCKLTQIATATGFNLAIASLFALLVGTVFSPVITLTRRVWPGVAAAVFVGVIGNLAGGWQLVQDLLSVGSAHSSVPFFGGVVDAVSGLRAVLVDHAALPPFDFWAPTRIVPPVGIGITEFPYFTFLFADLHPHLIAYPITAAMLALAVSVTRAEPRRWTARVGTVAAGALLGGALLATNPWDFPTYLLVVGLGVLVGTFARERRYSLALLLQPVLWCVAIAAGAFILFYPFEHSYRTVFRTGIGFTTDLVQPVCHGGPGSCSGAAFDALVTPLGVFLEHFGLFIFLLLSLLVLLLARSGTAASVQRWGTRVQFLYYYRDRLARVRRACRAVRRMLPRHAPPLDPAPVVGVLIVVAGLYLVHLTLLAFLALTIGLVLAVLQRGARTLPVPQLFAVVLAVVPLAIGFLTQIVYVKDFLDGGNAFRMNTIFKFYNQAWLLFAVIAAIALWTVIGELMPPRRPAPLPATVPPDEELEGLAQAAVPNVAILEPAARFMDAHPIWSLSLALLVVASLVYTYAGTVARETYRASWLPENSIPYTLDGMAFMKKAYPADYAGISWLNAHVSGAPVIAEADSGFYQWPSRVSMFTGLPDILNGNHEGEQRYADEMDNRALDLSTLYNSPTPADAWRVIRRYGVRYIFVGWMERHCTHQGGDPNAPAVVCYSRQGINKFQKMTGHGLVRVFAQPGITIYRVTA